ncbi:MAG TPA: BON domain-containing protein [Gemmatimonadales bacterium]
MARDNRERGRDAARQSDREEQYGGMNEPGWGRAGEQYGGGYGGRGGQDQQYGRGQWQDQQYGGGQGRGEWYGTGGSGQRHDAFDRSGDEGGTGGHGYGSFGQSAGGAQYGRGGYDEGQDYGRFGRGYAGGQYGQGQGGSRGGFQGGSGSQGFQGGYGQQGFPGGYGQQGFQGGYGQQGFQGGYGQQGFGSETGAGYESGRQMGYVGRGPKGYRRSDDRIREDVSEELTRHPGVDASEIDVRVENGEVTLTGTVESRQAKRMAEDCVEQCSGVKEVHNQLRVSRQGSSQESGQQGSRTGGREEASTGSSQGRGRR